jgi:hypothetical protein
MVIPPTYAQQYVIQNRCPLPISNVGLTYGSAILTGGFQILGNIHNNNTEVVDIKKLVVEIYNRTDILMAVESGLPEFLPLYPADYSPFKILSYTKTNLTSVDRIVFSCSY